MNMSKNTFLPALVATLALTFAAPAVAADSKTTLEPFLDDKLIAVARLDLSTVDAKVLAAWVGETMRAGAVKGDAADVKRVDELIDQLNPARQALDMGLGMFRATGATELYALMTTDELMANEGPPPLLVPITEKTNVQQLQALLNPEG